MTISMDHVDEVIASGPYSPEWESLAARQMPGWFAGAKFGIFTHWGVFSVPEFSNEWYSRNMYIEGYPAYEHHIATYGSQKDFGYKDLIPLFTAERFDPTEWLDLFSRAGAQYYLPVAEHHDGFQMYRTEISHWNAVEMGPHRDVIGELRTATLEHSLHFGTSSHRAEHWWFMGHGKEFDSDVREPLRKGDFYWPAMPEPDNQDIFSQPYPTQEYLDDWVLRTCELIENYRPELLYFDWWIQHEAFKPSLKKVAAFYYNCGAAWGYPVSILYKDDCMAWGAGILDMERGGFADVKAFPWQTDTSVARNSWCYTDSLEYKTVHELLVTLIDTVSKNGNLLLNVGPRADGSIAEHDREILEGIGAWMAVNSEGIYGSQPWKVNAEGPTSVPEGMFQEAGDFDWVGSDVRYTSKGGHVYAYFVAPGTARTLVSHAFAAYSGGGLAKFHGIVRSVEQLGYGVVDFDVTDAGMVISRHINEQGIIYPAEYPVCFRISIE